MIYPKIQTLWKRNRETGVIMEGKYSLPEFPNVKLWDISEKIDGMNIRIEYDKDSLYYDTSISFKGRTDKAQIPQPLWSHLEKTFTEGFFEEVFKGAEQVTIFGEGYGPKIRSGGLYCNKQSFIGFDIFIDGWWLTQQAVYDILSEEKIEVVPHLGRGSISDIVNYVKRCPSSLIADKEMEGIVCRSFPLMLFRNKNPVMFKLKAKDYKKLEEKENEN